MATKSIVGRFLILAILVVCVGVVAQAGLIITQGGKKATRTAVATPAVAEATSASDASTAEPVRVVYPGPLGDVSASKPKLADAAPASPLNTPAPETTSRLAQAMVASAQPAVPASQPVAVATAASSLPDPAPAAAPQPIPAAEPAPVAQAAPVQPASPPATAGVEVASLGASVPADEPHPAGGVNINTASVAELNRLGGGHIGESIAKHRPYRSVEELVSKRVLRHSVYDHIKGQIAAK